MCLSLRGGTGATDAAGARTALGLGDLAVEDEIDTTMISAATLVTEADTIESNDNDTTIPTSAAVKAYVDGLNTASRTLLATKTASASSSLDFTEFNNATYLRYEFELYNVIPGTDSTSLYVRTSTNGGSSYEAGGSSYYWGVSGTTNASATTDGQSAASAIILNHRTQSIGNAATEFGVSGMIDVMGAPSSSVYTELLWRVNYWRDIGAGTTGHSQLQGGGARLATTDVDAIRFLFSSGTIASGTIRMYGII